MPKEQSKLEKNVETMQNIVTQLIDAMSNMSKTLDALSLKVDKIEKTAVTKKSGLFGGKRERTAVKDTETGVVHVSKAACGRALAAIIGADPDDHFVWYKILNKFPDRFVELIADNPEAQKAWADHQAKLEAEAKLAGEDIPESED